MQGGKADELAARSPAPLHTYLAALLAWAGSCALRRRGRRHLVHRAHLNAPGRSVEQGVQARVQLWAWAAAFM